MTAVPGTRTKISAREVALQVVRDVFGTELRGAQAACEIRARKAGLDTRDRAFAVELAYGAIKARRLLDWYLGPYLGERTKALPAVIEEILRLGIYQLRCMGGVEPRAAVYESVNLALRYGHRGTAGLVNAILRRFIADAPSPPQRSDFDAEGDYFGTAYSLPTWIATGWSTQFDGLREAVFAGVNAAPQRVIRVNALRAGVEDVRTELRTRGIVAETSAVVPEALVLEGEAVADDEDARWALQGEAACMPVDLLAPKPGESVLELCSGRGHKSVQLAARMRAEGSLACVEIDPRKVRVLHAVLERAGASNAAIVEGDATQAVAELAADAVLLDAPCSGLGILGRHPEARWRKAPGDPARLAPAQAALLRAAAARTKAGGRLVYSVCSTDPREGFEQIERFLAEEAAWARAPLPERYRPFATAAGDVAVPPGIAGRDGFFIAALERAP